jgi:hypothetical protein
MTRRAQPHWFWNKPRTEPMYSLLFVVREKTFWKSGIAANVEELVNILFFREDPTLAYFTPYFSPIDSVCACVNYCLTFVPIYFARNVPIMHSKRRATQSAPKTKNADKRYRRKTEVSIGPIARNSSSAARDLDSSVHIQVKHIG